jgi:hypothetical protein
MRRLWLLFILSGLLACRKNNASAKTIGTLTPGVGCTAWVIQIAGNSYLQPTNLNAFPSVVPKAGQRVEFTYATENDATTCMMGPAIRLTAIQDYP